MVIVGGVYHALVGIAALFNDNVYAGTPPYIHEFDLTSWAWALLLLGVLVAEVRLYRARRGGERPESAWRSSI